MPPSSSQLEIFEALSLLRPRDMTSHAKRRIGRSSDGGYVMFDDFDKSGPVYSFGIGTHTSFDEHMAKIGKQILMFDHTIDELPTKHQNFNFYRSGLSQFDQPELNVYSLDYYVNQAGHTARSDMVLKIDVEGVEWDVLPSVSDETLTKFRQIVLEVHWLHQLNDTEFRKKVVQSFQKMNKNFVLGHVHSNNHTHIGVVEGLICADVLELTYLRADIGQHIPSRSVYPMELDYPNLISSPDHLLWFYPFLPVMENLPIQALRDSMVWSGDNFGLERAARLREEIRIHEARIATLRHSLIGLSPG